MNDHRKVSVIILNWNRAEDSIMAVESVLMQDYDSFEVIVWDNASVDDSPLILRARFGDDCRVVIHQSDKNYGVAGGRNRACQLAMGDVLLMLDSDAYFVSSNALSLLTADFESDPKIGALSFEVIRGDQHLMWPFARPSSVWRNRSFKTIRADGCSFAVRRKVYDMVGGFSEHLSPYGVEDLYFSFQLIGRGMEIRYFPSVVVVHNYSPRGRQGKQFRRHVRNHLWMILELFPLLYIAPSFVRQAIRLLRDAIEQRQVRDYIWGVVEALAGFKLNRRCPLPPDGWKCLRHLIAEDKKWSRQTEKVNHV